MILSILSGIFYRIGGADHPDWLPKWFSQKLFRTVGIGLLVGITFAIKNHSLFPLLCAGTYFLPDCFPYGEKSWMKIKDEYKFLINGVAFGLASFPAVTLFICILNALISGLCFWFLYVLDSNDKLKNPWVEALRGICGTLLIFGML